jgi:hypothetical protein
MTIDEGRRNLLQTTGWKNKSATFFKHVFFCLLLAVLCFVFAGCWVIEAPYKVVKWTIKGTYYTVRGAYELPVPQSSFTISVNLPSRW